MPSIRTFLRRPRFRWAAAVALLAAAVYANSLGNGFARDDVPIVEQRELVRAGDAAAAFAPWWRRMEVSGGGRRGLRRLERPQRPP